MTDRIPNDLLKHFASRGLLRQYSYWLMLKKQYKSGCFHTRNSIDYKSAGITLKRTSIKYLEILQAHGLIRKNNRGFTLVGVVRAIEEHCGTSRKSKISFNNYKELIFKLKSLIVCNSAKMQGYKCKDSVSRLNGGNTVIKTNVMTGTSFTTTCNPYAEVSLSAIRCAKMFGSNNKTYGHLLLRELARAGIINVHNRDQIEPFTYHVAPHYRTGRYAGKRVSIRTMANEISISASPVIRRSVNYTPEQRCLINAGCFDCID